MTDFYIIICIILYVLCVLGSLFGVLYYRKPNIIDVMREHWKEMDKQLKKIRKE